MIVRGTCLAHLVGSFGKLHVEIGFPSPTSDCMYTFDYPGNSCVSQLSPRVAAAYIINKCPPIRCLGSLPPVQMAEPVLRVLIPSGSPSYPWQ